MKVSDLVFKDHPAGCGGTITSHNFSNGYGASIITGSMFYTRPDAPYELAVLHNDEICYDSGLTEDVIGFLTEQDVNDYLLEIEVLPAK